MLVTIQALRYQGVVDGPFEEGPRDFIWGHYLVSKDLKYGPPVLEVDHTGATIGL